MRAGAFNPTRLSELAGIHTLFRFFLPPVYSLLGLFLSEAFELMFMFNSSPFWFWKSIA